jgi:hypothetical protein
VRIEAGPYIDLSEESGFSTPPDGWNDDNRWGPSHDTNLDCGALNLEEALLELARLVRFFYLNDRTYSFPPVRCDGHLDEEDHYHSGCTDAGDGFCSVCGFNTRED